MWSSQGLRPAPLVTSIQGQMKDSESCAQPGNPTLNRLTGGSACTFRLARHELEHDREMRGIGKRQRRRCEEERVS